LNTAHDVDLEYLSHDGGTAGTLDIGDVITGYINFTSLLNTASSPGLGITSPGNDQLTAFFDIQVTSKTPVGGGQFAIKFGPDTSGQKFLNGQLNPAGSSFATLYGADAMVAVYTAGPGVGAGSILSGNLSAYTSLATAASGVTSGDLYWVLGFENPSTASTGTTGEGWAATGSDNFNLGGVSTGTILGNVNFTVNILPSSGIGPTPLMQTIDPGTAGASDTLAGDGVQFIGSSTLRGAGTSTAFTATSDSDIAFLMPTVPEPASLAFLSLGALALLRRR
jgi:hypothetical protein